MEEMGRRNGKPQERAHLFSQLQTLGQSIRRKNEVEKSSSPFLLFKHSRIRKHFVILSFCWSAFYVSYFGLMYNLRNLNGNEFINFFLLSVVEIPGNILFYILMDRVGRRWTASIGFIAVGIVCLGPLTGFLYSDVIFSSIGKFISTGIFMVTDQQGTELFPTIARSSGISMGKTIATAITLLIPFLADLGAYGKNLPFILISLISLVAGILASFLPETLNENLPQTFPDADNFGKDQKFFSWIRRKSPTTTDENRTDEVESFNPTKDETSISNPDKSSSETEMEAEDGEISKLC